MGNKNPPPDERVVYLALKNVFKGPNAAVRQNKVIRKLVKEHKEQEDVADLVREHNFEVICNSARTLLCDEIFSSTLKAKIRFPELFDLSPTQSAEREVSEAEAAKNEANAIANALQGRWDAVEPATERVAPLDGLNSRTDFPALFLGAQMPNVSQEPAVGTSLLQQPSVAVPPLFPVYLPFQAQHTLLVHLQKLLEQISYNFGKNAMPDIMQQRGWDCAEAVELNRWTEEFMKRQKQLPTSDQAKKPLEQLFRSIANIRHTAVHRIRISAKGVEQFLLDAESLATMFGDVNGAEKITNLRRETQTTMEELQRNKHFLRSKLEDTLRGIAAQREELKRLEVTAIAEMEREDREYQVLASRSVDEAIAPSEASFSTAIDTEKDTITGGEDTDEMEEEDEDMEQPGDAWETKI